MDLLSQKLSKFNIPRSSLEACVHALSTTLNIPKEKVVSILRDTITHNENEGLHVQFTPSSIIITSPDDDMIAWVYDLLELKGEYNDRDVSVTFPITRLASVMAYILFGKLYTDEDLAGEGGCDKEYSMAWLRGFTYHLRMNAQSRASYRFKKIPVSLFLQDIGEYRSPIGDKRMCKREKDRYTELLNYAHGRESLFSLEVEMLLDMFPKIDRYTTLSGNHTYSRGEKTGTYTIIVGDKAFVRTELDKISRGISSLQAISIDKDGDGVAYVAVTPKNTRVL